MDLIEQSFSRLFPDKQYPYQTRYEYNRRLSKFNANMRLRENMLEVHLNIEWKDIDNEIKIGLFQLLLLKVLKKKGHSSNIDLYNNFIKNIPLMTNETRSDPLLEVAFERINNHFFNTEIKKPHLKWGKEATRKLAHYNFHDDTITVSSVFKEAPTHLLEYVLYHELLHKHLKYEHHNGRSSFHSKEFRDAEKLFPGAERIEKELQYFVYSRKKKRKKWLFF